MICDFGLSRIVNMNDYYQSMAALKEPTLNGMTPLYASPEVRIEMKDLSKSCL